MSDSDRGDGSPYLRGEFLAIVVLIAYALVGVLAYSAGGQNERRTYEPHQHAISAADAAQERCAGREPSAMAECIVEEVAAAEETSRSEQDLKAQQQMALWALLMVIVSAVTVGVTVWALTYIKETLDETRKMANDTQLMAHQSAAATTAMLKQNRISERSLDALYRPRVHIRAFGPAVASDDVNHLDEGEVRIVTIRLAVVLENVGNEPISLLMAGATAEVTAGAPVDLPRNELLRAEEKTLIGWQADCAHLTDGGCSMGTLTLTQREREDLMDNGVVISGRAFYKNVLDELYEHGFAFRAYPIWGSGEYQPHGGTEKNYRRKVERIPETIFSPKRGFCV